QFGSDLDKTTQAMLARGVRLVEILKQDQYSPLTMEKQVLIIYAATNGFVDDYDVSVLLRYEAELNDFVAANYSSVMDEIRDKKKIDDDLKAKVDDVLNAFKEVFKP
ncbi:MAG: F0F1 ATP synthase subunit alpha, partial [Pseudomonadota bacterium]|nr:F0F1 ATP synthase subunit alpha [Pseudomonadota bacterium]